MEELDIGSLDLEAIIDLSCLQALLDYLSQIANIPLAIVDLKGKVLIAVGSQDICTRFHRVNPQTAAHCAEGYRYLAQHVRQGEFAAYKCKNGLWDMLAPLYVGGRHVGNIYAGQFFYDDETLAEDTFLNRAEQYGFDRESYLEALSRVPRLGRAKVHDILNYVAKITVMVSELSYGTLRLKRILSEQQRSTETLRTSYDIMYNSMRDAFVRIDMEGHFKDYNQYYLDMLGYTPQEIEPLTYRDLTPEKWHAMEAAIIEQQVLVRGYSEIYEKEYRRKDGEVFPVELSTMLLKDADGKPMGMWGIVRDITERKRAEEILRASEERHLELLRRIRIGIIIHAPDATIQFCNEEASRMMGLSPEQMQGKAAIDPAWRFIREDGSPMPPDEFPVNRVLASLQPVTEYVVGVHRPGTDDLVWGLVSAYPEFAPGRELKDVVVTFVGITERKRMERSLVESENRLRTLLQTIPDLIWLKDPDGIYLLCNRMFERFFGAREADIIGKTDYDFVDKTLADFFRDHDRKAIAAGRPHSNEEWLAFKDGSCQGFFETIKTPMYDAGGKLIGVLGVSRDINERKQAEEERLAHARFLESMDLVARTIQGAHDLDQMMGEVLDAVQAIFKSDRAWLLYPCDPQAAMFTVPMIRTRPGYPDIDALGISEMPIDSDRVKMMGMLLEAGAPVSFGPGCDYAHLDRLPEGFPRQTQLCMAIYPKLGKPWVFGLHQCSHAHQWTTEEKRLFQEIGRRLSDGLTGMLTQRDLRKSEQHYRSLFENMLNGYAYCRMLFDRGRPIDFVYLDVNGAFESLTGLKDVAGKKISEIFPDIRQSDPEIFEAFGRVALTGIPERFEIFLHVLQQWFSFSAYSPEKEYFVAVFDIITERKRAEEALLERDALFAKISSQVPGMLYQFMRRADGTYCMPYSSDGIMEIFGCSPQDVRNDFSPILNAIVPEDRDNILAMIEASARGLLPWTYENRVQIPGKPVKWVIGNSIPEKMPDGSIVWSGYLTDITARIKEEEERKKLEDRLQQSYKMEAIGALAGGIAHDFNNILSSVLGFTELAKMKFDDKKDIKNELDEIYKAGIRARDLVKQILAFSRQSGIKKEPMMLVPLIKETVKFLRASLPATIEIRQDLPASDSMVIADPTQMHQVIMNLCTNAAYAMKDSGGVLDIRLVQVDLGDAAQLDSKEIKPGRYWRLSVGDTGRGISKEIMGRIFDPFFTTKGRGEGTGMGLAVVHGIVRDMEGDISVYSEPGQGTTFNILLPLYEGETAQSKASDASVKTGKGRILFVDDEQGVLASGRGILERLGYVIVSTTSPFEAMDLFTANPEAFDLVLTDLTMPKMTGLELSERLHQIKPTLPIVLSTGFPLGVLPEKLRQAGIRDMVMKPMVASELSQTVYKALHPS